jgi:hypothetical protein
MTVRDVNMRYPQAYSVFEQYGIAGCGGKYGPPESLNFFAQAHKVDCAQLIADLEAAIRGERVETVVVGSQAAADENTLYRGFVRAALICGLTAGAAFGLHLLADIHLGKGFRLDTLRFAQAHAGVQIYGWVGLFILGFAYHAIPRFKNAPLRSPGTASLSLVLISASLVARLLGQLFLDRGAAFGGLLVSSGILLLLGYGAFFLSMVMTVRRAEAETEFYEKFVVAALVWGLVSVVINLAAVLQMVDAGRALIPPGTRHLLRHVQFYGFITLMIAGVSYRLLPGFLGTGAPSPAGAGGAFVLFNAGILLWIAGALTGSPALTIAGYGAELLAAALVVVSLKVFTRREAAIEIEGEGPSFPWAIRLSYAWLVVAVAMIAGGTLLREWNLAPMTHSFLDAYRHAFTMGFVATIILGVAQRVLPVWEGKVVYSARLMAWSVLLLTVGNVARFLFETVGGTGGGAGGFLVAGGGALEFLAILLFSVNVWKTLGYEEEGITAEAGAEAAAGAPAGGPKGDAAPPAGAMFGPKTKVFEILHEVEGAEEALRAAGIGSLPGGARGVPKFLTLERLCRSHGVDIEAVIRALEAATEEPKAS